MTMYLNHSAGSFMISLLPSLFPQGRGEVVAKAKPKLTDSVRGEYLSACDGKFNPKRLNVIQNQLGRSILTGILLTALCLFSTMIYAEGPVKLAETLTLRVEESEYTPIEMEVVVNRVLNNNLDVALSKTALLQAKGARISSFAGFMPSIKAQGFVEKFTGSDIFVQAVPISVNRTTHRPKVSLDYQLPLGGKPFFKTRVAKHQLDSVKQSNVSTLQEALRDALTYYFTWLGDQKHLQVAEQSLDQAQAYVRYNQLREKTGFGTQFEIEQANVQQAERETAMLETKNKVAESAINLMSQLNLPLTINIKSHDAINGLAPFIDSTKTLDLKTLLATAEENRPDVKDLASQIKAARALYRSTFSDLFPTLGISSYVGKVGPNTQELRSVFQRGVMLNVDVLRNMGLDTIGKLKTNKARMQEAILSREKKLRDIQNSLAKSYFNWQKVQSQLKVAEQKRHAAGEALRIAQARQNTGFGIQLEVLQNQTSVAEAAYSVQTLIQQANIAQVDLLYETGQLTPLKVLTVARALSKEHLPMPAKTDVKLEEANNETILEFEPKVISDDAPTLRPVAASLATSVLRPVSAMAVIVPRGEVTAEELPLESHLENKYGSLEEISVQRSN